MVESVPTNQYHVWITVLIPSVQSKIINRLINQSFSVCALASDGKVCHDEEELHLPCHTLAISVVSAAQPDLTAEELRSYLMKLMQEEKINCLGLVISRAVECSWLGANFRLNSEVIMQAPVKTDSKLN
jgi:hypothetical protein